MSDRRRGIPLAGQVVNLAPLLILWGVGLLVLFAASAQRAVAVDQLFLDRNYLDGAAWYSGLLSNVGILCWAVAATAAAGGSWLAAALGRPGAAWFLGTGSLLTVWLLADDLLATHAAVLPQLGVSKTVAMLAVVSPAPVWLWVARREIARTRWLLFVGALGAFCTSVAADVFVTAPDPTTAQLLLEDGAKLLGILAWAQYFVLTTLDIARSVTAEARTVGAGPAGREGSARVSATAAGSSAPSGGAPAATGLEASAGTHARR